jgi:tetratricopeptide (TPR) repeat protein
MRLLALACCLLIAAPAPSQTTPASFTIYGAVRLPDGSRAPKAIVLLSSQMNPSLQVFADDLGRYEITNVPSGRYWLTAANRSDPEQFSEPVEVEMSRSTPSRLLINIYLRTGAKVEPGKPLRSEVITLTEAAQRIPKSAQKAFNQALKYRAKNQYEKAMESYSHSIDIFPTYMQAYAGRGHLHILMNRLEEAAADFARALELDKSCEPALRGMGTCKFLQEDWEGAIEYFERAISVSPRNAINHLFFGVCSSQLDRRNIARAALEKALAIDPRGAVRAHVHLANLWIKEKRPHEAIAELEAYLAAVPNAPDAERQRALLAQLRNQLKR